MVVTGVNVTVCHVSVAVGYVAPCTGCQSPASSRYSTTHEAGGRIQLPSRWNSMPTLPVRTGASHVYCSQSVAFELVVPR